MSKCTFTRIIFDKLLHNMLYREYFLKKSSVIYTLCIMRIHKVLYTAMCRVKAYTCKCVSAVQALRVRYRGKALYSYIPMDTFLVPLGWPSGHHIRTERYIFQYINIYSQLASETFSKRHRKHQKNRLLGCVYIKIQNGHFNLPYLKCRKSSLKVPGVFH